MKIKILLRFGRNALSYTVSLRGKSEPSTFNTCWQPLLPQMVQVKSGISLSVVEIVNIAKDLQFNHQDVEELPQEELMVLVDASTSDAWIDENMGNEWVLNHNYWNWIGNLISLKLIVR